MVHRTSISCPSLGSQGRCQSISVHTFSLGKGKGISGAPDILMFCSSKLKPTGRISQKLHFSGNPSLQLAVPTLGCAIFPCQGYSCSPESSSQSCPWMSLLQSSCPQPPHHPRARALLIQGWHLRLLGEPAELGATATATSSPSGHHHHVPVLVLPRGCSPSVALHRDGKHQEHSP